MLDLYGYDYDGTKAKQGEKEICPGLKKAAWQQPGSCQCTESHDHPEEAKVSAGLRVTRLAQENLNLAILRGTA